MDDFAPVRVEPNDKTRCQAVGQNGEQCPFQGMPDPTRVDGGGGMGPEDMRFLKKCRMHGSIIAKSMKKEAKRLYLLKRWNDKVDRLSDPEIGTNLDEELGVLRMMLETALNKYEELELLNSMAQISGLVRDIRDTLTANKKIKSQMGELMDRTAMHKLCDGLVAIISKHVPADKLDEVGQDVAGAIANAVSQQVRQDN